MSELRTNRIIPRDGLPSGSAGGIIQVKSTTMTEIASYSISGMTWTEVGGLTTTITPTRSDSKILIMLTMGGMASNGNGQRYAVALRRDNSNLTSAINSDGSNHTRATWAYTGRGLGNALEGHPAFNHLDSPATTSATTYRVMITTEGSYTLYVNRSHSDSSSSSVFRTASSLTLMEISG